MLGKAGEWKLIARAPKIKLMKEHGRDVILDADAEEKLVQARLRCKGRARTRELFRDIVALMRDTGMRNERELFQIRIENLDWHNRTIFVPDSKTPEGRRLVPMSRRVFWHSEEALRNENGWLADSFHAIGLRAPEVYLQLVSASPKRGRTSKGTGVVLRATRLRHSGSHANREPGCRKEDHGTPGWEDCNALSASRTRNRPRCAGLRRGG
jgi:integrase